MHLWMKPIDGEVAHANFNGFNIANMNVQHFKQHVKPPATYVSPNINTTAIGRFCLAKCTN